LLHSILLALPLLVLACTGASPRMADSNDLPGLPDAARPRLRFVEGPGERPPADGIRYRAVTRADFRATEPPGALGPDAARMGAYTCGTVLADEPIAIRIEPIEGRWVARAPELVVYAEMDRSCSWWNEKLANAQPPAYILQHEQIHFALFELSAREMQARGRALVADGDSAVAARDAFQRALQEMQREVGAALLRRTTEFDRDTSGRHEPVAQQRWYDRVHAELAQGGKR
jgi:hypothetical protein